MKQGVIEAYEEEQLVVALPDLAVVRGALRQRAVGVADEQRDERLGLALLTLSGVAAGAAKLREDDSGLVGRVTEAKRPGPQPDKAGPSDLDLIIFWLRECFQSAYGGWVPTIGKNRVIEPVRGLPYIGGGGEGEPLFWRSPRSQEPFGRERRNQRRVSRPQRSSAGVATTRGQPWSGRARRRARHPAVPE